MTIDKLARKNIELQQTFKKELEEKIDLCAGCDIPSIHLQYAQNGKPYCPRCYEEVKTIFEYKR